MRIDQLIKELHSLRRGIIPRDKFGTPIKTGNVDELYMDTLYCLHVEIATKMSRGEFLDSVDEQNSLNTCKKKWGNNLKVNTISKGMPTRVYRNEHYYSGWEELHDISDGYFLLLVKIADIHGMLLTDKKEASDEPDEWDEGDE